MKNKFLQFKKALESYGLTDDNFNYLIQYCNVVNFKKGQIIIEVGEKQNFIYFIIKGLVRNFIINNKRQTKTYNFRSENMLITGYGLHNFQDEYRSLVNTQCLDDCEMLIISYTGLQFLENNFIEVHKIARFLSETHTIELVKFRISLDTKSLMERYEELLQLFPGINKRVSQSIIASYLGVSSVHLSRVKNKEFRK